MIGARHNIKQAHDDDTNSFYFEFHLNQRINLLKLKKNLIPTNKKAPVRRLFEPEAFHLQISSINLEETFVLLYISHVFQYVQPLHQQQVNLGH